MSVSSESKFLIYLPGTFFFSCIFKTTRLSLSHGFLLSVSPKLVKEENALRPSAFFFAVSAKMRQAVLFSPHNHGRKHGSK